MIRRDGCESTLAEIMSIWPPIILTCICLLGNNGLLWSHATLFCSCLPGKRTKWEHREKSEYSSLSAWRLFFFFFTKETMRTWDLIALLFRSTNRLSLAVVCPVSFFPTLFFVFVLLLFFFTKLILHRRLKVFATCIQTHKTLHFDNISWTSQHYMRLACTSQVINMGNTSFRWMNDSWWGHCPLYLPFIPLLPFFYLCYTFPFFLSFFPFNVYIPLNSVCSFYWLLWNR